MKASKATSLMDGWMGRQFEKNTVTADTADQKSVGRKCLSDR